MPKWLINLIINLQDIIQRKEVNYNNKNKKLLKLKNLRLIWFKKIRFYNNLMNFVKKK